MKFTFIVSRNSIDQAYEKALKKAIAQTTIKGFRTGQAPKELVVQKVGETKLQQMAIEDALPHAYSKAVKDKNLKPIAYPELTLKKGKIGEDFEFEAEIAQMPEIKLGDYKKAITKISKTSQIWTPDKKDSPADTKEPNQEEKIDLVLKKLLEVVKVEVPQLLIDREVQKQMSSLLDQLQKLGLKVEDYLKSVNQTKETLTLSYQNTARDQLALEFILMEIAKDMKISISQNETESFIKSVTDKNTQIQLQSGHHRDSLIIMLTKQKVIQELLALA